MNLSKLLETIDSRLNGDNLVLPTMPDIAMEINNLLSCSNVNISDVVALIKKDPAIAASVIKYANSALVRGISNVKSVEQAAIRIGINTLRNIILGFAVKQMFFAKNIALALDLSTAWKQASDVAISAGALLHYLHQKGIATHLEKDVVFLTSLVHNIGYLPVLTEADSVIQEYQISLEKNSIIKKIPLNHVSNITNKILVSWNFDDIITVAASKWTDLNYVEKDVSYTDIIRLGMTTSLFISKDARAYFNEIGVKKGIVANQNWSNESEFISTVLLYKDIF